MCKVTRVLGLDLSMNQPGFALVEAVGREVEIIDVMHIKQDTKKPHGHRLQATYDVIDNYLYRYGAHVIVRERGFSRHNKTTQTLFKVVGVADLIAYRYNEMEIVDLSPTEVRKLILGQGNAGKLTTQQALERYVGKFEYDVDDESDAVAVAVAYLIKTGEIEPIGG